MLAAEEENEAEVRREDQDNINQFARLNARLNDAQNERERLKVRYVTACTLLYSLH
jgi:prefoldin subunit 4